VSAGFEAGGIEWADLRSRDAPDGLATGAAPTPTLAQLAATASVLLAVLQHVQVVLELLALRKGGPQSRRRAIVTVEAAKFMLRLVILAHRQATLLDGGAYAAPGPEEEVGSARAGESSSRRRRADATREGVGGCARLGVAATGAAAPAVHEIYVGRRSGRKLVFASPRGRVTAASTPERGAGPSGSRHSSALLGEGAAAADGATDGESSGGSNPGSSGSGTPTEPPGTPERVVEGDERPPAWLGAPAVDLDGGNRAAAGGGGGASGGGSALATAVAGAARRQRAAAALLGSPGAHSGPSPNGSAVEAAASADPEDAVRARAAALAVRWTLAAEALFFARPLLQVILK
jgi:hypothetical protein